MTESLRGLRLSRFYNYEQPLYIPAPTGGWNPDANPWELPDNQAMVLDNFIIKPGKIVLRNPFTVIADLSTIVTGAVPFCPIGGIITSAPQAANAPSGTVLLSRQVQTTLGFIDPWNSVLRNADAAHAAQADTFLYQVALDTGTMTKSAALTADQIPGPRHINFDGLIYAISYDSASAAVHDTNSTYFIRPLSLVTLPSTQTPGVIPSPTVLTNAPHGAFDLKGYLSRIWLLGGVDTPGGLTAHESTTLYYTNPGTSGVGTASADWKDPISNLVNKIKMDNDISDYGVGLAVISNAMMIFRRASVWILRGSTSQSFTLQPVSQEVGCLDARSIVETDHGVYFISHRGLEFTDGSSVINVSGSVAQSLITALYYEQNQLRINGGWISSTVTSNSQIMISVGVFASSLGNKVCSPIWTGLYDPGLNVWTRMTSSIWQNENAGVAQPTTLMPIPIARPDRQQLLAVGDSKVTLMENFPGFPPSFLMPNSSSSLFDLYTGSIHLSIPAVWQTRIVPMNAAIHRKAIAKRILLDYTFSRNSGFTSKGWSMQPFDAADAPLQPEVTTGLTNTITTTGNGGALIALPRIQRKTWDFQQEIEDMYIKVLFDDITSGPGEGSGVAEIYGLGIEFQRTSDTTG